MTTKETLHELIDNLSDEEAAGLLARVRQEMAAGEPGQTTADAFWEFLDELAARIPAEDLASLASSDLVDEVVYRQHGR